MHLGFEEHITLRTVAGHNADGGVIVGGKKWVAPGQSLLAYEWVLDSNKTGPPIRADRL